MSLTRAAIYCRISQDREGAGLGVERQRKDCEALARRLGYEVVATYTDNDMSAYSGKPRPGYRALLADLEAGRCQAVIVWHTDRLHRSPRELEEYITVCEQRNITTQTVQAGELDLATPSGRAVARTLGAWARYEVEHKSKRTKAAQLQAAEAGRWLGGAMPLGWNVKADGTATLDRAASSRIRRASTAVLAGQSLGSIVADWNSQGFTTSTGRAWTYSSLRQVLSRARNAGLIEYNGAILSTSRWPAIVTEDTWRALRATLADPGRRRSYSNRARWLLAGIAVCGAPGCGQRVKSATVGSNAKGETKRTVYRCVAPGAGHVARSAPDVDNLISRVVLERLARADVRELLPIGDRKDVTEIQGEAVTLRARLTEAAESFADGAITVGQLGKITARVSARLADVEGDLAQVDRGSALSEFVNARDPAAQWDKATIDRKRAAIAELMTVTILPGLRGKAFDSDLIRVDWRR